MASERYYKCLGCGKKASQRSKLLNTLRDFPKTAPCSFCGGSNELHLAPPFALGSGTREYKVLDAFHESVSWENDGNEVVFLPFLVILEDTDKKNRMVWLPYWHVDGRKAKFGERAPWMDASLFEGLLRQARAKGYVFDITGKVQDAALGLGEDATTFVGR